MFYSTPMIEAQMKKAPPASMKQISNHIQPQDCDAGKAKAKQDAMKRLRFYVVNNIKYEKTGGKYTCRRNLTLPEAIDEYNAYCADYCSAIGVSRGQINTELVRRIEGESVLIVDYLQMEEWQHNPYLCVWAISQLVSGLDIKSQMESYGAICPILDRVHVMRLKDADELRPCFFKSRDTVRKMGVDLTMDQYDLLFTENMKYGEAVIDVCNRYRLDSPANYYSFAPTVSDVLLYQTRMGCHALYIDSVGFDLIEKFVRPPGGQGNDETLIDPLYVQHGINA